LKIGITYNLQEVYLNKGFSEEETAEFDSDVTIDAIENALKLLGHTCERIGHLENLMQRLLNHETWDLVFNIAEGMYGFSREAQIPAILDAYKIPYTFSDSIVLAICLHKAVTKRLIRDMGLPTPDFIIIQKEDDLKKINLPFPLFVKPISEGSGIGIDDRSIVNNTNELETQAHQILKKYKQPVLVEKYLVGKEYTVGILGTGNDSRVIGVLEVIFKNNSEKSIYSFSNKKNYKGNIVYKLVDDPISRATAEIALKSWKGLNCRDAGRVDLRLDENGVPNFIEMNPLAGLNPLYSDLTELTKVVGMDYNTLIKEILDSAMKRIA
jgi:D-alanine-D-alanine ligase